MPRTFSSLARRRTAVASPAATVALLGAWSALSLTFAHVLRSADCVRGDGMIGLLASAVAQMRTVAECPAGTLGYGPHTAMIGCAIAVVLAALVITHMATSTVTYWVAKGAAATRDVLAALAAHLPHELTPLPGSARGVLRAWVSTCSAEPMRLVPVWRRGPPVLA